MLKQTNLIIYVWRSGFSLEILQIFVYSFYHWFVIALGQFFAQEYAFLCKFDNKNVIFFSLSLIFELLKVGSWLPKDGLITRGNMC